MLRNIITLILIFLAEFMISSNKNFIKNIPEFG